MEYMLYLVCFLGGMAVTALGFAIAIGRDTAHDINQYYSDK